MKEFLKKPPLGWNSWDCYGAAVNEAQLKENADYMAEYLKEYGWEYVVCDIQWFEPTAKNTEYNSFADLVTDEYGRALPASNRFPSAGTPKEYYLGVDKVEGEDNFAGFKPIADYVHSLGLKFGIHILRGIPRQAVARNLPIKGSKYTAREVAHSFSVCSWNTDMYGLRNCEGAQDYYNSICKMYAEWGVDFIKCDDIALTQFSKFDRPYSADYEIEMLSKAIENSGRDMVLSLSPGPAPIEHADHLKKWSNMWRMTDDFWDKWELLLDMFDRCKTWEGVPCPGHYPDCDMLPLGRISKNGTCHGPQNRYTQFTKDEQLTMLSLWGIFSSPLMFGGNLPDNDDWTLSLLTNREYITMQQNSHDARECFRDDSKIIWTAKGTDCSYIAIFNVSDDAFECGVDFEAICKSKVNSAYEIWSGETISADKCRLKINSHGVKLFRVS